MRGGAFGSVLSALAILSLQTGDFSKSCSDISVSRGGVMSAECRTFTSKLVPTQIDLNERIANIDGRLQIVGSNGNFARSCKDLDIENGSLLKAQCKTRQGRYVAASIDLDDYIENVNGSLEWDISRSLPLLKALRKPTKNVDGSSSLPLPESLHQPNTLSQSVASE